MALIVFDSSDTVVEFQLAEYGALVSSLPTGVPSTLNCTPAMPSASDAEAANATDAPDTVDPDEGAVMLTLGAELSTTTGSPAVLLTPLLFVATAARTCGPSEAVAVFHDTEYGADVSAEPRFAPSSWNCTFAIPDASDASADTVTALPDTVPPTAGAVSVTVGAGSGAPHT